MKSFWVLFAAILTVASFVPLAANDKGPGPQGVGATAIVAKSHEPRSYNPLRLVKKDKNPDKPSYVVKLKKTKAKKDSAD
jgi:hypothetical protein